MNDLHCSRSFVKYIASLSVSPSDAMSSFIIVLVCLSFFFLRILHVVHCVEFCQLSFFLHVQTIGVFAEWKDTGENIIVKELFEQRPSMLECERPSFRSSSC